MSQEAGTFLEVLCCELSEDEKIINLVLNRQKKDCSIQLCKLYRIKMFHPSMQLVVSH